MSKYLSITERLAYRLMIFLARFLTPLGLESIVEELDEYERR